MVVYCRRTLDTLALLCAVVIMAANLAPTFADLLAADSDFVMPTTDPEVQVALASFGASRAGFFWCKFKKTKSQPNIEARAELLAGLALLHTHHLNLARSSLP